MLDITNENTAAHNTHSEAGMTAKKGTEFCSRTHNIRPQSVAFSFNSWLYQNVTLRLLSSLSLCSRSSTSVKKLVVGTIIG